MTKLSLDALKERAEAVTAEGLMTQIGGGTENACHPKTPCDQINDLQNSPRPPLTPLGEAFLRWWHDC